MTKRSAVLVSYQTSASLLSAAPMRSFSKSILGGETTRLFVRAQEVIYSPDKELSETACTSGSGNVLGSQDRRTRFVFSWESIFWCKLAHRSFAGFCIFYGILISLDGPGC